MRTMWIDRKRTGSITVILVLTGLLLVLLWPDRPESPEEAAALAEGRIVITYWDRHSGHEHAERQRLIKEYNDSQHEVFVRALPIGFNAMLEKTLTSIAGGAPPDIISLDGGVIHQLAPEGLFLPLEDLIDNNPLLGEQAYFPHIWPMVYFNHHLWGMPTTCDAICLVWNKEAFRKASLDPERPPATIAELEEYASKLTVCGADGAIEQMGYLPWIPWDQTDMWGSVFGGHWFDKESGWCVCGKDPGIIAAFTWQKSFTRDPKSDHNPPYAMNPAMVSAFSKGMGEYMSAQNPFYSGKIAMTMEGEWQVAFIPKFAPGLDWGVAPLPHPEGVAPIGYGLTVVVDAVPSTARHPEAAKKFLRWFYSPRSDTGISPVSDFNERIRNIPPKKEDALQDRFMRHPKFGVFVRQLLDKPVAALAVTPVARYFTDQIERQRERVVMGEATPEQAAREVEEMTNRELARVRNMQERRKQ